MSVTRRTAAWTIPAFAAAGILDAAVQIGARPYWFASPSDRLIYGVLLALLYGALGAILALPFGLLARALLRRRAGGEAFAAAALTFLFWAGFWVHLHRIKGFLSISGIGASGALLLAALGALLLIRRHPPGRGGEKRVLGVMGIAVLLLLGGSALRGIGGVAPAGGGPNVLLLVIDTLRADRLSCYGHPRRTSPVIDRVAREGVLFPDAISPAPFTQPGVASLLTGNLPSTIGVVNHPNRLEERWVTLAEAFRAAGYRTGFANPHPLLTPAWGFTQGFEEYRYLHKPVRFDESLLGRLLARFALRTPEVGYQADRVTEFAIRLLERKGGRPFFIYAHYLDPHYQYKPPAPYDRMFTEGQRKARLVDERLPDGRRRIFGLRPSREEMEETLALYDGEVAFTDREIGRLLDALDRLGLREKTIVAITSDHGESLGDQGLFFAHTHLLYDPTQRVPLVLRYPERLPAGVIAKRQTSLVDLAPALLRLAGVEGDVEMDGRVPPVVEGMTGGDDRPAFAENGRTVVGSGEQQNPRWYVPGDEGKWRMVRTGGWKLIRIPTQGGVSYELYDLDADPGETKNLVWERLDVVASLAPLIDDWLASIEEEDGPAPVADEETMEGLRELGYIR